MAYVIHVSHRFGGQMYIQGRRVHPVEKSMWTLSTSVHTRLHPDCSICLTMPLTLNALLPSYLADLCRPISHLEYVEPCALRLVGDLGPSDPLFYLYVCLSVGLPICLYMSICLCFFVLPCFLLCWGGLAQW